MKKTARGSGKVRSEISDGSGSFFLSKLLRETGVVWRTLIGESVPGAASPFAGDALFSKSTPTRVYCLVGRVSSSLGGLELMGLRNPARFQLQISHPIQATRWNL